MKVFIDSRALTKDIGSGVGWYTKQLIESLIKYTNLEAWAWYNAFGETSLREILPTFNLPEQPIKITHWPNRLLNMVWNFFPSPLSSLLTLDSIIGKADIFHAPSPFLGLPPAKKIKRVVTIHDLTFLTHPETHSEYDLVMSKTIKKTVEQADAIIAVSQNTKTDLMEILKVPEDKIFVVYEASREIFRRQKTEDGRRISENRRRQTERNGSGNWSIKKPYFLYVGNIEPRKNLIRLVKAYEQFLSPTPPISPIPLLVLAGGRAWKSDEIIKTVENSPIREKIILTGYVDDNELLLLYNNALALFYVPLYEGFGLPVLEAFACGCPVITSNTSSLPEVGGKAAEYVDPKNVNEIAQKMVEVASWSQEVRGKKQEVGLSWAKNFSWEKAAQETKKAYQSLFP